MKNKQIIVDECLSVKERYEETPNPFFEECGKDPSLKVGGCKHCPVKKSCDEGEMIKREKSRTELISLAIDKTEKEVKAELLDFLNEFGWKELRQKLEEK